MHSVFVMPQCQYTEYTRTAPAARPCSAQLCGAGKRTSGRRPPTASTALPCHANMFSKVAREHCRPSAVAHSVAQRQRTVPTRMANSEIEPPALSHAGYLRTNSRSHELPLRHHRTRADADAQLGAQQSAELAWHGTTKIRRWLNWCGAVGGSTTESSAGGSEAGGHSGRRRSRSSMARTRQPHGTRASAIHLCGPSRGYSGCRPMVYGLCYSKRTVAYRRA